MRSEAGFAEILSSQKYENKRQKLQDVAAIAVLLKRLSSTIFAQIISATDWAMGPMFGHAFKSSEMQCGLPWVGPRVTKAENFRSAIGSRFPLPILHASKNIMTCPETFHNALFTMINREV